MKNLKQMSDKYSDLKIDENFILTKMIDMKTKEVLTEWECPYKSLWKEEFLINKEIKKS